MRLPTLAMLIPVAVAACGGSDPLPSPPEGDGRFTAVFISDTHITGPGYECCSETPGIDNTSIVKTEDRLREVVRQLNAIRPRPDLVFLLGDVTHDPYDSTERAYYDEERTAFHDLRDLLAELEIPYHIVWGNHDYDIDCERGAYVSRELSHELFAHFFASPPYQAIDHKGWRFLLLNSMLGPTWEPGHPLCDTGLASYGAEQLAWVDAQLGAGMPATVLSHYTYGVTATDEDPGATNPDLETILERHATGSVVLTLAGHLHRWLDFGDAYPFPHVILGATRYDTDNFWVIEFDPAGRSYRFLDDAKSRAVSTCSDSWAYDGVPGRLAEQPADDGDCE